MSSFDEGYKFGVGIMLAAMEMDVVNAEVDLEIDSEDDREYNERDLEKKKRALEQYKSGPVLRAKNVTQRARY